MATSSFSGKSMAHSPGRPGGRRGSHSPLLLLLGLFLLALVVISQLGENGIVSWWKLRAEVADLQAETTGLQERNRELEARIDALLTDPATLEKIAREQFNMQRPDEEVLMILPPAADGRDPSPATPPDRPRAEGPDS